LFEDVLMMVGMRRVLAEAIEKSHTILVFVSRKYNDSVNCMKEAKYAHQRM
jgi:hypothetical protein